MKYSLILLTVLVSAVSYGQTNQMTVAGFDKLAQEIKNPIPGVNWGGDFRVRNEYFNNAITLNEGAIRHESLEHDLHWFRFYVGNLKGEFTFEALKDNEPWAAGESALASCGWSPTDKFYSARLFMVLRRSVDEAPTPA